MVLNREYKPLGFKTREHVEYEAYPIGVKVRLTAKTAAKLSWNGSTNTNMIFLYEESCTPTENSQNMRLYLERVAHFAKLKVL